MNRDNTPSVPFAALERMLLKRERAFKALARENERRAAEGKPPLRLRQTKPKP